MFVAFRLRKDQCTNTLAGTSMAMDQVTLSTIQKSIWAGQLPLHITLAPSESRIYDQTDPYLVQDTPCRYELR